MSLKEKIFKTFHEKNAGQRYLSRKFLFPFFERFGFHVVGDHFYEIIPNTREIVEKYSPEPRSLEGIAWNFDEYEARALDLLARYGSEYAKYSTTFGFHGDNYYFRGIDALMLYVLLRDRKPAKMVEVGQGFSTRIALAALDRNALETGVRPHFISIDPFPRFRSDEVPDHIRLEVVEKRVQELEGGPLLSGCDFLFVDSSHVFKFGSDVAHEINVLYGKLPPGSLLHVHDIFSPFDYPREWMLRYRRFWNEQYFLECFLMYNAEFTVRLPLHYLLKRSKRFTDALATLISPGDFNRGAGSFYIERRTRPA